MAQHFGEIALGAQLGFEIETGREVEIAVRRARETIDAAAIYNELETVHFFGKGEAASLHFIGRHPLSRRQNRPISRGCFQ
jgi:hypothetical protein